MNLAYSSRQNSPMTTYSELKRGPWWTSDFEKDAFCRNQGYILKLQALILFVKVRKEDLTSEFG